MDIMITSKGNENFFVNKNIITLGTKEELGHAIGKEFRASLAILDEGFSKAVMKKIESLSQVQ